MHRRPLATTTGLALVAALALSAPASAATAASSAGATGSTVTCDAGTQASATDVSCSAVQLDNTGGWRGHHIHGGGAVTPVTPAGYGPAELQQAYNLTTASAADGKNETVAVVDAYDDPTAQSDLATYRAEWGLPPICGGWIVRGCVTFTKVNQKGQSNPLPAADPGWAQEISVDVDMVSAVCPHCDILLVEANAGTLQSLGRAENTAAAADPVAIGNSYGVPEGAAELALDADYTHPGIAITASAGDDGYGVSYPASSPDVIAVGGTTLSPSTVAGRPWTETAWSGDGSGCSTVEPQPAWQRAVAAITSTCHQRAVADVAAVADPTTGVAVYDSYQLPGWTVFGGTSVSAQIIAAVFALAGPPATVANASGLYTAPSGSLFDVTSGSDGPCGSDLCTAAAGWDGPTGLGTPNGTAAF